MHDILPAHLMPQSNAKIILLIELLETERPYNTAEAIKSFYVIISAHGGSHVNTAGRKIVCTLTGHDVAAETACELMACSFPGKSPFQQVARMCICQLPAIADSKEAHAQAIASAARELVKASPGQIVATQDTAENLSDQYEIKFGSSGGNTGMRVFEITRSSSGMEDSTRIVSPADRSRAALAESPGKQIYLRWRGKDQSKREIVLNSAHPVATFGREDGNDIVIESGTASRRHGKIECHRDSIFIIDESTNGTFVVPINGNKFVVHKEKKPLPPRGYISLGEQLNADHPGTIQFVTGFSVG